jgi:hypothetical protein
MGVEWVIADTNKKIFYYLGKGGWHSLTDMECFQDLDYLIHELSTEVYDFDDEEYWSSRGNKKEMAEYVYTKVSPDLHRIFKDSNPNNLVVFSDCHGDDMLVMKSKQYICVGSRYAETFEKYNRHLNNSLYSLSAEELKKIRS